MTQLITNKQKHPSSHMHKYCSMTAFNIHYIRIPNCTLLPIIIISHRSINFEQKCRRVVSLSVDKLSQKILNSAGKQKWQFPRFAKLIAFFWLDLIKLLSFVADNILSSPSTQRNTNHLCNLIWSDTNDPYNLKSFRINHP